MSTSYGKAMQVLSCAPAQVRDSFSHYEGGISPRLGYWAIRGDQRKRLMGAAFPLADLSISGQLWEVALPDKCGPVPTWTVTAFIRSWEGSSDRPTPWRLTR